MSITILHTALSLQPHITTVVDNLPRHYQSLFLRLQDLFQTHQTNTDPFSLKVLPWIESTLKATDRDLFAELDKATTKAGLKHLSSLDKTVREHFGLSHVPSHDFAHLEYRGAVQANTLAGPLLTWMEQAHASLQCSKLVFENREIRLAFSQAVERFAARLALFTARVEAITSKNRELEQQSLADRKITQIETQQLIEKSQQVIQASIARCETMAQQCAQLAQQAIGDSQKAQQAARALEGQNAELRGLLATSDQEVQRLNGCCNAIQEQANWLQGEWFDADDSSCTIS